MKWNTETLSIALAVVLLLTIIALVNYPGLSKKVPINYVLLFVFTLCEAWIFAWLTVDVDRVYKSSDDGSYSSSASLTVIMTGVTLALTTIALTIYAFNIKKKVEVLVATGPMTFLVIFGILPLIIISW